MTEAEAILIICAMLGGEPESRHNYQIQGRNHHIKVDCETETHVIEVGMDKRSSLDSVQQADFASWLSHKKSKVIIVDTDGSEGSIEYRIDTAARRLGVEYATVSDEYLRRWQMTAYFRQVRDHNLSIGE